VENLSQLTLSDDSSEYTEWIMKVRAPLFAQLLLRPVANCFFHQFISSRGNEYFCEIDEEYLTDRFNLTGLNIEVNYYQHALDLITDVFDLDCEDDMRDAIEKSARHLYGLVHARYIVTTRGLAKMVDKYKKSDFGRCPRVYCEGQPLLPCGLEDNAGKKPVKLYCARCEDTYSPKSSRHSTIDGAYFGTSFHNILFQVYPALIPQKSLKRFTPTIFGFKVHYAAALHRWQDEERRDMRERLAEAGIAPLPFSADNSSSQAQQQAPTRQLLFVEDAEDDDGMSLRADARLDDDHDDGPDADEDPDESSATRMQGQAQVENQMQSQAMVTKGGVNMGLIRARAVQAAILKHQQSSAANTQGGQPRG
jgi:casein kinase II subunit beta